MGLNDVKFNDSFKREYIESQTSDDDVRVVVTSRIKKISEYEQQIDKDMLSWSEEDFVGFFKFLNYKNANSASAFKKTVETYGEYALTAKSQSPNDFLELMKRFSLEWFRGYARETDSMYITHYDYENVINNKIRGEHMFPMEQVIMIILWHKVVKAPNDIFEFPMDKIDLAAKTIECFDGEIAHLSDKEVAIIREFKEQQNTRVYVDTGRGKVSGYYGVIEMEEDNGEVTTVYVGSDSEHLIHAAYGTSYIRENGAVVDVIKAAPIKWCFGKRRMLKIQESLSRKLDIHFTPFNIVRSRKYHDMIVSEGLTLFNLEDKFKVTRAKKFGINSASIKEVQDILEKEAKQELQRKYQKD